MPAVSADALGYLFSLYVSAGRFKEASAVGEEWLEVVEAARDAAGVAQALTSLGHPTGVLVQELSGLRFTAIPVEPALA